MGDILKLGAYHNTKMKSVQLSEVSQSMNREILTSGNECCSLELAALHLRECTCFVTIIVHYCPFLLVCVGLALDFRLRSCNF